MLLAGVLLCGATGAQSLSAVKVASGFSQPVLLTSPPDDPRLFVLEQNEADIHIIKPDGTVLTFLDLTGGVATGGERGLLGLAFHPDYADNGRFFVNYTRSGGATRVEEYAVSADPDVANPSPVQTIADIAQPFGNHNGGCIAFGLDGKLYVGMGDGGAANDPGNRAQDPLENLGKMLRYDVDLPAPFIPSDNPFVGLGGANDEIWALGLRNPWRFSFDRETGDLWIGDVGQWDWEEIHWASSASKGRENYGWRCMEGTHCTGLSGCTCNHQSLTLPVHEYAHSAGNCSVTGGYVYRGPVEWLRGTYFFGDYCSSRIWSFEWDGSSVQNFVDRTSELEPAGSDTISTISSFGQDAEGNLYVLDHSDGEIYEIVACGSGNYCVTTPNSAGPGAVISDNGNWNLAANAWALQVSGSVPDQFGLFLFGAEQQQVPLGNGTLCVGGSIFRIVPPVPADGAGNVTRSIDFGVPPLQNIQAGETWNFQWWLRDPAAGGANSNLSDGLSVTFCP